MFNSIPICRSIFDHWIYTDAEYLKIWVTMLGKARYLKEDKIGLYQKIQYTLKYGEFIFGRKQWSKDLGIGEQRIRTCIKKLEKDNMIVNVKVTSKFTIYSITNYEKFNHQTNHQQDQQTQQLAGTTNHQTNHQLTTIQPPANHQLTTNKEGKEGKEGKEIIIKEVEKPVVKTLYDDIFKSYNNLCTSLPKIKSLSKNRKSKLKTRIEELKTIEAFQEVFSKVEESDFLKGNNPKGWKCTFDWLIDNDNNYIKVLEGAYINKINSKPKEITNKYKPFGNPMGD